MKKIHLIAAAAALLLSGGVFMKANQMYDLDFDELIETVTAGADPTITGGDDPSIWNYGTYLENKEFTPTPIRCDMAHFHKNTGHHVSCGSSECKMVDCSDFSNYDYYDESGSWVWVGWKYGERTSCWSSGEGCTVGRCEFK